MCDRLRDERDERLYWWIRIQGKLFGWKAGSLRRLRLHEAEGGCGRQAPDRKSTTYF